MDSLSEEQLVLIRQRVHTACQTADVHAKVRTALGELLEQRPAGEISEDHLRSSLRNRGVVDDILSSIRTPAESMLSAPAPAPAPAPSPSLPPGADGKRFVYVTVTGGKAFIEHAEAPDSGDATLELHVRFMGQRLRSKRVRCCCDPRFDEGFLLEVPQPMSTKGFSDPCFAVSQPLSIVVVRREPTGETAVIGTRTWDWRRTVLECLDGSPNFTQPLEVNGVGSSSDIPAGVLLIRMDMLPAIAPETAIEPIHALIASEDERRTDANRTFLLYAKQWWKEFLAARRSNSERLVKLFAKDETGHNRPVCTTVAPHQVGRLLETPRQAARFVSLLPFRRLPSLGGQDGSARVEQWSALHTFLTAGHGDVEDHARLLCGLLLGFGLEAFVCIGTKGISAVDSDRVTSVAHAWVLTYGSNGKVVFWESLTAERFVFHRPSASSPGDEAGHPYRTLGCMFNNEKFYANNQPSDSLSECWFDLHNESHWKSMSTDAIEAVAAAHNNIPPPLLPPTLDAAAAANELEVQLRGLVTEHRLDHGLVTSWDSSLSYKLGPALASYELERQSGVACGNEEFQAAIKRHIPPGQTFKAFPIQFVHRNARDILRGLIQAAHGQEIVNAQGDQVAHALRVRVFPFPERTCAVWVMLAVRYHSIL